MRYLLLILSFAMLTLSLNAQSSDLVISNGEIEIGGTLLLPEGEMKAPLVILSTGSGAQDRNETIMNFQLFKIIAEDLAAEGIPSFRYDDRGVGVSTGSLAESTLEDLASDVHAITKYFSTEAETMFDEFIHFGHSQGGVVGIKSAAENEKITRLILMASPVVPMKDVISAQVRILQESMGKTEEEIEVTLAFQDKVYEAVRTGEGWDSLKADYRKLLETEISKLPPAAQASIKDWNAFTEAQFSRQVKPMRTPQMSSFMHYDPREDLATLDIPVYAIFGGKDTQVTIEQNYEAFNKVCEEYNLNCTTQILNDANHLFQKAETGMVSEYQSLPKEFIEGFTYEIYDWILYY
jgi:hypothetical protein